MARQGITGNKMLVTFSSFSVCDVIEVPHERFRQWLRRGDVEATTPAEGQGTRAEFTAPDIYRAELFKRLVDSGYRREVAAGVVKQIDHDSIGGNILVYSVEAQKDETKFFARTFADFKQAVEFMESYPWREVRVLNLAGLRRDMDNRIKDL